MKMRSPEWPGFSDSNLGLLLCTRWDYCSFSFFFFKKNFNPFHFSRWLLRPVQSFVTNKLCTAWALRSLCPELRVPARMVHSYVQLRTDRFPIHQRRSREATRRRRLRPHRHWPWLYRPSLFLYVHKQDFSCAPLLL